MSPQDPISITSHNLPTALSAPIMSSSSASSCCSFDQSSSIQSLCCSCCSSSSCSSSSWSSSSSTSSLATLYKKEIDHFNNGQKFFSRNRFVIDPEAESVDHWPIWPTNLYFTANTNAVAAPATATTPTLNSNSAVMNNNESPTTNVFLEDSCDSGCDSLYAFDPTRDEPQRKRSRFSPLRPSCSLPFSGFPDTALSVSEFDCDLDLLLEFCGLPEDEQLMTSASSLFSESSSQEEYF
jgi:hypothetical protein